MTEKDAIKCAPFADQRMWTLPVKAKVRDSLLSLVLVRIDKQNTDGRAYSNHA